MKIKMEVLDTSAMIELIDAEIGVVEDITRYFEEDIYQVRMELDFGGKVQYHLIYLKDILAEVKTDIQEKHRSKKNDFRTIYDALKTVTKALGDDTLVAVHD